MSEDRELQRVVEFPLVTAGTDDVDALITLLRRLSISRSIPEVSEIVTHGARTLLGAAGVTFVLREGDQCYYAEEDAISPLWKGRRFPITSCVSGWCMIAGEAAVISDIYQDPRVPHEAYRPTFVRSLAMVPVRQDDPIAAMGAYWPEVREISSGELKLLQGIANTAALAIAAIQSAPISQKQVEERSGPRPLVTRELNHRIKNLLTLVEALIGQTADSASSLEEFRDVFHGRLRALARAQAKLLEGARSDVDLHDLVVETVANSGADIRHVSVEGDPVKIAASQVLPINLTLHELCTNALKYGALSVPNGRVLITCSLDGENSKARLSWIEVDGPPVKAPDHAGFGTELIKSLCPFELKGSVDVKFEPSGLRCEVAFPLKTRESVDKSAPS